MDKDGFSLNIFESALQEFNTKLDVILDLLKPKEPPKPSLFEAYPINMGTSKDGKKIFLHDGHKITEIVLEDLKDPGTRAFFGLDEMFQIHEELQDAMVLWIPRCGPEFAHIKTREDLEREVALFYERKD